MTAIGSDRVLPKYRESSRSLAALLPLLVLAFALRAASPLLLPNISGADEVFQTVEQAYRLLTGRGFIPWEYYYGIRSWIFPGLLAGIMEAGWKLGLSITGTLTLIRLTMAAASLPIVACAYFWGRRSGYPGAAPLAAGLVAIWPDLVFFSSHPLFDVAAAAALVPGIFLADAAPGRAMSRGRVLAAALLLSFASVLRVQIGPVALLAWAWMVWADRGAPDRWRRWLPALIGGAVPVLVAALVDWASWGRPLQSLWLNAIVNWGYGAATTFGTSPWFGYFAKLAVMWGAAAPFLLGTACLGAGRARLPAAAAVLVLLVHMLIAHKEYRFIYPAIPLIVTLAAIGTARLVALATAGARALSGPVPRAGKTAIIAASVVWVAAAGSLYLSREYLDLFRKRSGPVAASLDIARARDVCGVAVWGLGWLDTAGESALGHVVPVFYPETQDEFASRAAGFNAVLYAESAPPPGPDWQTRGCHFTDAKLPSLLDHGEPDPKICVAVRTGGCAEEPPLIPPLFLPRELVGVPFPWFARPLPDRTTTWAAKGESSKAE